MKRLSWRFLALAALVVVLQVPLGYVLDGQPFYDRDRLDRVLQDRVDLLYLGDSVLSEGGYGGDRDLRGIARMLGDQLEGQSLGLLQNSGFDLELYGAFVEYLARKPQRPRGIVVPINFRFFNPDWPSSFELERTRLTWGDPLGLGFHRPCTLLKWSPSEVRPTPPARATSAEQWLSQYDYALRPEHPKLIALRRLIHDCRKAGMVPVIYVTPLNLEKGLRLGDREFATRIRQNVEVCRAAAASVGEEILDLSALVPEEKDFEKVEHLREQGRRRVAAELARVIRKKFSP